MESRRVRYLALVCGLLLALPQDWCCAFAEYSTTQAKIATKTLPAKTIVPCSHCCQQPRQQSTPTRKPQPPSQSRCPCSERRAILASIASIGHAQAAAVLFAIVAIADILPAPATPAEPALWIVHPPTSQLHVFLCVWLC